MQFKNQKLVFFLAFKQLDNSSLQESTGHQVYLKGPFYLTTTIIFLIQSQI